MAIDLLAAASSEDLIQIIDRSFKYLEWNRPSDQQQFTKLVFPQILTILQKGVKYNLTSEAKCALLKLIHSFQLTEYFTSFAEIFLDLLLQSLRTQPESVGLLSMKIIMDWHRYFKSHVESKVPPFFEFVKALYDNFPLIVKESLLDRSPQGAELLSAKSFKIVAEAPINIVILFQIHRRWMTENIGIILPSVVKALSSPIVTMNQVSTHSKSLYPDYFSALVKTLSLLAYTFRWIPQLARSIYQHVPNIVLQLLKTCPGELSNTRKELLVATRHILSTEFRTVFTPYLEDFLDEKVMIGSGLTATLTLRQLTFSMIADLIHHVRLSISRDLLEKILAKYSDYLLDYSLPISIQTMSAKLLINLIETLSSDVEATSVKLQIFRKVFKTLSTKFRHMLWPMKDFLEREYDIMAKGPSSYKENTTFFVSEAAYKSLSFSSPTDATHDSIKDVKFLIKTIINGMKLICLGIKSLQSSGSTSNNSTLELNASNGEDMLFRNLFNEAIEVFQIFQLTYDPRNIQMTNIIIPFLPSIPGSKFPPVAQLLPEDKDLMDQFSFLFSIIPQPLFYDIISSSLPKLLDAMIKNPLLVSIPQYFLAIHDVSRIFSNILLKYLIRDLETLGTRNYEKVQIYLRLFKLVFLSVSVFPDENEIVLQQFLGGLIKDSLKLAQDADEPIHYFYLLRSLFRSIGGGRFELLYKEVLPLLPILLDTLNPMLLSCIEPTTKELFIELCLTIPVRLSVLLPYLSSLMKPLVLALTASPELINQGLRTLELCIDNLTHEFLEPILAPVMPELLDALWRHCKPLPYSTSHSHPTLRILGKLAGRGRKSYKDPVVLTNETNTSENFDIFHISFPLIDNSIISLEKPKNSFIINIAISKYTEECYKIMIDNSSSIQSKTSAYGFCSNVILKFKDRCDLSDCYQVLFFAAASASSISDSALGLLKERYTHENLNTTFPFWKIGVLQKFLYTSIYTDKPVEKIVQTCLEEYIKSFTVLTTGNVKDALITQSHLPKFLFDSIHILYSAISYKVYRVLVIIQWLLFLETEEFRFSIEWIQQHSLKLLRALFIVFKDVKPSLYTQSTERAKNIVKLLFKNLQSRILDSYQNEEGLGYSLCAFLLGEVCHPSWLARETSQEIIEVLFNQQSSEFVRCMSPLREKHISTFISKPIKLLPIHFQVGMIEGLHFLLLQSNHIQFISADEDIWIKWIEDIVSLADDEDSAAASNSQVTGPSSNITNVPKGSVVPPSSSQLSLAPSNSVGSSSSHQSKQTSLVLSLRIACVKLLSLSIPILDSLLTKNMNLRNRIIQLLFKCLYARSKKLVQLSQQGLAKVISIPLKLPKDLLQAGLRPVLMNLSDPKRLTITSVQGLGRLLELLTTYFKVEIGRKLLDHIHYWVDSPGILIHMDISLPSPGNINSTGANEQQMIISVFSIFHLLPANSNVFLEEILSILVKIENLTNYDSSSPFRPALLSYILKYPTQTLQWLLDTQNISSKHAFSILTTWCSLDDTLTIASELLKFLELKSDQLAAATNTVQGSSQNQVNSLIQTQLQDIQSSQMSQNYLQKLIFESLNCFLSTEKFKEFFSSKEKIILPLISSMTKLFLALIQSNDNNKDTSDLFPLDRLFFILRQYFDVTTVIPPKFSILISFLQGVSYQNPHNASPVHYSLIHFLHHNAVKSSSVCSLEELLRLIFIHFIREVTLYLEGKFHDYLFLAIYAEHLLIPAISQTSHHEFVKTIFINPFFSTILPKLSNSNIVTEHFIYAISPLITFLLPITPESVLYDSKGLLLSFIMSTWDRFEDILIRQSLSSLFVSLMNRTSSNTAKEYSHEANQLSLFYMKILKAFFSSHSPETRILLKKAVETVFNFISYSSTDVSLNKRPKVESNILAKSPWWLDWLLALLQEEQHLTYPLYHGSFVIILPFLISNFQVLIPYMNILFPDLYSALLRLLVSLQQQPSSPVQQAVPPSSQSNLPTLPTWTSATPSGSSPSAANSSAIDLEDPKWRILDLLKLILEWSASASFSDSTYVKSQYIQEQTIQLLYRLYLLSPNGIDMPPSFPLAQKILQTLSIISISLDYIPWEIIKRKYEEFRLSDIPLDQFPPFEHSIEEGIHQITLSIVFCQAAAISEKFPAESLFTTLSTRLPFFPSLLTRLACHSKFIFILKDIMQHHISCLSWTSVNDLRMGNAPFSLAYLQQIVMQPDSRLLALSLILIFSSLHLSDALPDILALLAKLALSVLQDFLALLKCKCQHDIIIAYKALFDSMTHLICSSLTRMEAAEYRSIFIDFWLTLLHDSESVFKIVELNTTSPNSFPVMLELLVQCDLLAMKDKLRIFHSLFKLIDIATCPQILRQHIYSLLATFFATDKVMQSETGTMLEPCFLKSFMALSLESEDLESNPFLTLLHQPLPEDFFSQVLYVLAVQNWSYVDLPNWVLLPCIFLLSSKTSLTEPDASDLYSAWLNLLRASTECVHSTFCYMIAYYWNILVGLCEFHMKSYLACREFSEAITTFFIFLSGIQNGANLLRLLLQMLVRASPCIPLIPFSILYPIIKKHSIWYEGLEYMEKAILFKDQEKFGAYNIWFNKNMITPANHVVSTTGLSDRDYLSQVYYYIKEEDIYYGRMRQLSLFAETNVALSLEQIGEWENAQLMYELVQAKARAGLLPYPIYQGEAGSSSEKDGFSDPPAAIPTTSNPIGEFVLWEERWIQCAKKLQQWDMIVELAKIDHSIDLSLEGSLRLLDWTNPKDQIALQAGLDLIKDVPDPRRKLFEAFLTLNQIGTCSQNQPLLKVVEEGFQCVLQFFASLSDYRTAAHLPYLHTLQEFVEMLEAQPLYSALAAINLQSGQVSLSPGMNPPNRPNPLIVQEIKSLLQTWRERMPNVWEDLEWWSELTTWRQHVFALINIVFSSPHPLNFAHGSSHDKEDNMNPSSLGPSMGSAQSSSTISGNSAVTGGNAPASSMMQQMSFRGFHETAWMINRFAHIARKQALPDVCIQMLNKIYTLPNIEIQDAFLKLREQAKCYLSGKPMSDNVLGCPSANSNLSNGSNNNTNTVNSVTPALSVMALNDLATGLEIINATNLNYFNTQQKTDFFTLKAKFLSKLGQWDEANKVFAQAVQLDLHHAKAWLAWGDYHYTRCKLAFSAIDVATSSNIPAGSSSQANYLSNFSNVNSNNNTSQPANYNTSVESLNPWANNAMYCYLQAATLSKSFRARSSLSKTFYFLSFDSLLSPNSFDDVADELSGASFTSQTNPSILGNPNQPINPSSIPNQNTNTLCKSFELYYQDIPAQSWLPSIPYLVSLLTNSTSSYSRITEIKLAKLVLFKIAKFYPQTLFYILKSSLSDKIGLNSTTKDWYHLEELMTNLKTMYPLLCLTMETLSDHLCNRLKPTFEEEAVFSLKRSLSRLTEILVSFYETDDDPEISISVLLSDFHPLYDSLVKIFPGLNLSESHSSALKGLIFKNEKDILKFFEILSEIHEGAHQKLHERLGHKFSLDNYSRYLSEFQHTKYVEDLEVPGYSLYLAPALHQSSSFQSDLKSIQRIMPGVITLSKETKVPHRCFSILTTDGLTLHFKLEFHRSISEGLSGGSKEPFDWQLQERWLHSLRYICPLINRKKETRSRGSGLQWCLPLSFNLSNQVHLIQEGSFSSFLPNLKERMSLQNIIDEYPLSSNTEELSQRVVRQFSSLGKANGLKMNAARKAIFSHFYNASSGSLLTQSLENILSRPIDLWLFRKQFTYQYGVSCLLQYIFDLPFISLHDISVDMGTGSIFPKVYGDPVQLVSNILDHPERIFEKQVLSASQTNVPFRLSPVLSNFMTPLGLESWFSMALMATSRVLLGEFSTSSHFELENPLLLYFWDALINSSKISTFANSCSANMSWPLLLHKAMFSALDMIFLKTLHVSGQKEREKYAVEHLVILASLPPGTTPNLATSAASSQEVPMTPLLTSPQPSSTVSGSSSVPFKPVHQAILSLIGQATHPDHLAQQPPLTFPWL